MVTEYTLVYKYGLQMREVVQNICLRECVYTTISCRHRPGEKVVNPNSLRHIFSTIAIIKPVHICSYCTEHIYLDPIFGINSLEVLNQSPIRDGLPLSKLR